LEKTVDDCLSQNPKMEYNLVNHEGPASSQVKNVGLIGRMEKQGPDTFFINTQDRWLTTTGAEKGETLRPIQEMGILRRTDFKTDYTGCSRTRRQTSGICAEKLRDFETPRNIGRRCQFIPPLLGRDLQLMARITFAVTPYYSNHRSTMKQPDAIRSGFGGAIGAVIAPFMDILRPSRKEEHTHNIRIYGEAGTTVPQSYILNPNDTAQTTIKETTLYAPSFNIDGQKEGSYLKNKLRSMRHKGTQVAVVISGHRVVMVPSMGYGV
jgi:hypothetical protein